LEGKGGEGFVKNEGAKWKKWRTLGAEGFVGSFFFIIQNPPCFRKLKNCIGEGFWGGFGGFI